VNNVCGFCNITRPKKRIVSQHDGVAAIEESNKQPYGVEKERSNHHLCLQEFSTVRCPCLSGCNLIPVMAVFNYAFPDKSWVFTKKVKKVK
jgi:hypothetical protein